MNLMAAPSSMTTAMAGASNLSAIRNTKRWMYGKWLSVSAYICIFMDIHGKPDVSLEDKSTAGLEVRIGHFQFKNKLLKYKLGLG